MPLWDISKILYVQTGHTILLTSPSAHRKNPLTPNTTSALVIFLCFASGSCAGYVRSSHANPLTRIGADFLR